MSALSLYAAELASALSFPPVYLFVVITLMGVLALAIKVGVAVTVTRLSPFKKLYPGE
ncbi:MAG: hypothetical protein AAGA50_07065 [Pseudomonadota bacterium]